MLFVILFAMFLIFMLFIFPQLVEFITVLEFGKRVLLIPAGYGIWTIMKGAIVIWMIVQAYRIFKNA